ncbi:hypothetical protein SEA_AIKOY__22 [Mycobacterium phage Aikoy]|uniref:Uncharacterized protein n=1 Tax=Mycobacterium phage Onyinye TaxID=2686235 RepID=A0A6B9LJB5_9CAUD|nr:hypothetical protein PP339_gp023 [Mycobacterium phage Onyinye]QHB37429.1 hypothetical protein SEA_ONYINYE_23 [Mycobacterium phage Onyinye]WKW85184.1 hypothetical protein SEA_AIKOY__22 [Mycobacterium phage Aikoy]
MKVKMDWVEWAYVITCLLLVAYVIWATTTDFSLGMWMESLDLP